MNRWEVVLLLPRVGLELDTDDLTISTKAFWEAQGPGRHKAAAEPG
jgi:hypothetical protein